MNLIGELTCGVRGAENGFVEVFSRGTSNHAQIFTSYDGSGASTPTGALTLDANGGRVLYVNEEVDCVVTASTGITVRTFSPMVTASNVEARSQSFTGVDYTTGASAASNPVALSTILDLWKTNAGAADFKVLLSGVATTLSAAFAASVASMFYNVKSSAYGAVGDGVANDTSAVQAALTAAGAGAIVFFPPGIYRVTSALNVPLGVTLMGAGYIASVLLIDHATANLLSLGGSNVITGLQLNANQVNTGDLVSGAAAGNTIVIFECRFGGNGLVHGRHIFSGAALLVAIANHHLIDFSADIIGTTGTVFGAVAFCRFSFPSATAWGSAMIRLAAGGAAIGNFIDLTNMTSGAAPGLIVFSSFTRGGAVVGNVATSPGGGTPTFILGNLANESGFYEACNSVGAGVLVETATATPSAASHEGYASLGRDKRRYYIASDASPITLPSASYGSAEVARTTNANQTLNLNTPPGPGQAFTLTFNNNQAAGSGTITMGANVKGLAPFTVNANRISVYHFRSVEVGVPAAALYWSLVGSDINEVP